jgi:uncharacterized membrane protein YraQ (UPF0718 family)
MLFPAGFGFCSWVLLGQFSPIYAIINGLWCVIFVEYWKKQETDLAVQWGVRGVSKIQLKRPQFKHESIVNDPITGEQLKIYSPLKRLARQLLQVPFALIAALVLGSLIATCFGIEVFISEVYPGPFKSYLVSQSPRNERLSLTLIGLLAHCYTHDRDAYSFIDSHGIREQID